MEHWINKIELRRRGSAEMKEILAEYFCGELSDDEAVARSMGLNLNEIAALRREFEA
jgi:hypothetical protein